MPGRITPLVNQEFYHIYNRGSEKRNIYQQPRDYKRFQQTFYYYQFLGPKPKFSNFTKTNLFKSSFDSKIVEIICYSLMPNHFHFLVKQDKINGLKMFLHRLCTSYSSYFNKKYGRVGHIFQGIYKSKVVLEDSYLTQLTAYIHLNPSRPFEWKYYSMPTYLGKETSGLAKSEMFMDMHKLTPENYKLFLRKNYNPENLTMAALTFDEED